MNKMDLAEANRLGRVEPVKADFRMPSGMSCIAFRLPDYRYAGSGDVMLYALHSEGHVLFVDCGPMFMTDHRWFDAMIERHAETPDRAALFVTHLHYDHMGESGWFTRQGICSYVSSESEALRGHDPQAYALLVGARRETPVNGVAEYAEFQRGLLDFNPDLKPVPEGTVIDCGDWELLTMQLPGHMLGHTGLVTTDRRVLFAGDCVSKRPPIFASGLDGHDGAAAIECWQRLRKLPLEWLVTSHEGVVQGEDAIRKELVGQANALNAKAKRVLEELRAMPGYMTPCEFVTERKGADAIAATRKLGVYLNALNVQHYLAFLEFLYDYEQVQRRIDDDGAAVYEPARFNTFFA